MTMMVRISRRKINAILPMKMRKPTEIRKRYSITRQFGLMPVIGGLAAQLKGPTIPPIETADELIDVVDT